MSDFKVTYEKPEDVPLGEPTLIKLNITNTSGFPMKQLKLKTSNPEAAIYGDVPAQLPDKSSFQQILTIKPTIWNPDGLKLEIDIEATQVSR